MARGNQVGVVFEYVGDKKKFYDSKKFRKDLRRLNQKTAKAMKRSFEKTTKTWDRPVKFQQLSEINPEPVVMVYTTDEIYGYVSGGTSVRYAVMTPDFDPKTRPGVLDSYPGSGGVLFISKKHPMPGIRARNFPELVEEKHLKPYQEEVAKLTGDSLNAQGDAL